MFALGLGYEFVYLLWLEHVRKGSPWRAAAFSMLVGGLSLGGVIGAARGFSGAACLVFGYGVGSYLVARRVPG